MIAAENARCVGAVGAGVIDLSAKALGITKYGSQRMVHDLR